MVCSRCQILSKPTSLATPEVKKKNDMYYGSPASSSSKANATKTSATLGQTGIGKSKLMSKSAKNPYAAYSSSCTKCHAKLEAGRKYCAKCAYQLNSCAMCGKKNTKSTTSAPVIDGMKRTLK